MRFLSLAAALALLAGCGNDAPEPASRAGSAPAATPGARSAPPATARAERAPAPAPDVALVWGVDDPERAERRLERLPAVADATVAGRRVELLRDRPGYAIPLDVLTVEPRPYARTVPAAHRAAFARLGPGDAVLSRTSARLRDARAGSRLRLEGGRTLRVTAVVPDRAVHEAELAVAGAPGPDDGGSIVALLRPDARPAPEALARAAERGAGARLVPAGAEAIGPEGPARPAELKARFGEPAVALPYGDDWIDLDPAFTDRHLVSRTVPILGTVTCHRAMIAPLRAALGELERRGLAGLVDPGDYAGCHAPRRIRPGGALSLHAWGLAVDLNASANPLGGRSTQDPRLVRTMVGHGFTWGGDWPTVSDPMHFEWRGRATRSPP